MVAIVRFPRSWPAHAVGWTLYLLMAIASTTWFTGLLVLAVLSVWWVLRQATGTLPRRWPTAFTTPRGVARSFDAGHDTDSAPGGVTCEVNG